MPNTCLVAQIGARMHYAVPRLLHEARRLEHLYTDICAVKGWPRALKLTPESLRTPEMRRLLDRIPHDVPRTRVTAFNRFGLEYSRRLIAASTPSEITATVLWAGRTFCELVLARGMGRASALYAFNGAALELLRHARENRRLSVLEQTLVPKRIEMELLEREQQRHPGWETPRSNDAHLEEYCAREEAEWYASDVIICGSEFVRAGIARCGGPDRRCHIVPNGVDSSFFSPKTRPPHHGPLRVLTVGVVGLRKGSPDVSACARRLKHRATFRMVGPVEILPEMTHRLSQEVELTGPVPRSEMIAHYHWADVFLLPSICEGSATAAYEAMACGLPVIVTPNAGTTARDGVEGLIVPPGNVDRMVAALKGFIEAPALLETMARRARARAVEYDLRAYGQNLVDVIFSTEQREELAA